MSGHACPSPCPRFSDMSVSEVVSEVMTQSMSESVSELPKILCPCPSLLRVHVHSSLIRETLPVFRTKILDADIDEFISNLSPDTSDMSDDSGPFQN